MCIHTGGENNQVRTAVTHMSFRFTCIDWAEGKAVHVMWTFLLLMCCRSSAPGEKECASAMCTLTSLRSQLQQAIHQATNHTLTVSKSWHTYMLYWFVILMCNYCFSFHHTPFLPHSLVLLGSFLLSPIPSHTHSPHTAIHLQHSAYSLEDNRWCMLCLSEICQIPKTICYHSSWESS